MAKNTNVKIVVDGQACMANWRKVKKLYKRTCRQYGGVSFTKKTLAEHRQHWPHVSNDKVLTIRTSFNWL
jgi:hypothetical protein